MMRAAISVGVLLPALALQAKDALGQARGPAQREVRSESRALIGKRELQELADQQSREQAERERLELLDPVVRSRRIAELESILHRLPGRFRIDGRIEQATPMRTRSRKVKGVADCAAIGGGVGVSCIINATWPVIEDPLIFPSPIPLPSDTLNTMRPAVLVVGLNIDPPGVRAMMVTADTLAFNWVGTLKGHGASRMRPSRCQGADPRCYPALELVAEPDGTTVSLVLTNRLGYVINLTMYPDPDAAPETALEPMRIR